MENNDLDRIETKIHSHNDMKINGNIRMQFYLHSPNLSNLYQRLIFCDSYSEKGFWEYQSAPSFILKRKTKQEAAAILREWRQING